MKNAYTFILAFFSTFYCYSQANPCDIDSAAYRYYYDDAVTMAQLRIQFYDTLSNYHDSIHISSDQINEIVRPLCYFYKSNDSHRDSIVNIYNIHHYCYPIKTLYIILDTTYNWVKQYAQDSLLSGNSQFDSLVAGNGFKLYHYFRSTSWVWADVRTDSVYNLVALSSYLAKMPGVISAAPESCVGDGNSIFLDSVNSMCLLTFHIGWEDCPMGCLYHHYWRFHITPSCEAVYDSSWGQPPYFVGQKPVAMFAVTPDTICENDCVHFNDLSNNYPTSWKWSFPGGIPGNSTDSNPFICYLNKGSYSATLIAANSSGSDTITFDNLITVVKSPPVPIMTMSHDTLFCSTDPSYVIYMWYKGDSLISMGVQDTFLVINSSGNYNVAVFNENCCGIAIGINPLERKYIHNSMASRYPCYWKTLYTNDYSSGSLFFSFPNPATNQLIVSIGQLAGKIANIAIYNVLGEKILDLPSSIVQLPTSIIDISSLSSGIYLLQMKTESGVEVKKFIKQ